MTEPLFERVYSVHDWYDGPRAGFADYRRMPHAYRSVFREDLDDWDPEHRFQLSPVSPALLSLALEAWEIFKRWDAAFATKEVTLSTHPALPADASRHAAIAPEIAKALELDRPGHFFATGEFRRRPGSAADPRGRTSQLDLEVCWAPAEP